MDGQVSQQSDSYRRGLVLGLTMAEIMILVVFCLLIALASFLKTERDRRISIEKELDKAQQQSKVDREIANTFRNNPALKEGFTKAAGSGDTKAVDEFWRELFESRAAAEEYKKSGLSPREVRALKAESEARKPHAPAAMPESVKRNEDIVAAIEKVMSRTREPSSIQSIVDALERGLRPPPAPSGHKWPPIISLSEAAGHRFERGSAQLAPEFRDVLTDATPQKIIGLIKQYDVDVIEVVGHTDEQPLLGFRQSNLDRDLVPVLTNSADISSLIPADNAGLGLARAVSVVSVLLQNEDLRKYKVIPLSAAQLVDNDETLATKGTPGDIRERRRIEIRLRKSTPPEPGARAVAPALTPSSQPRLHRATPKPPGLRPPMNISVPF